MYNTTPSPEGSYEQAPQGTPEAQQELNPLQQERADAWQNAFGEVEDPNTTRANTWAEAFGEAADANANASAWEQTFPLDQNEANPWNVLEQQAELQASQEADEKTTLQQEQQQENPQQAKTAEDDQSLKISKFVDNNQNTSIFSVAPIAKTEKENPSQESEEIPPEEPEKELAPEESAQDSKEHIEKATENAEEEFSPDNPIIQAISDTIKQGGNLEQTYQMLRATYTTQDILQSIERERARTERIKYQNVGTDHSEMTHEKTEKDAFETAYIAALEAIEVKTRVEVEAQNIAQTLNTENVENVVTSAEQSITDINKLNSDTARVQKEMDNITDSKIVNNVANQAIATATNAVDQLQELSSAVKEANEAQEARNQVESMTPNISSDFAAGEKAQTEEQPKEDEKIDKAMEAKFQELLGDNIERPGAITF